ncbi:alpha-1,3-arabinosyltransferase XAT2-like isoform X4 [Phragmites australis]|uniref:alpha-1,3-arabinosyltransferase XAT2-like isoform X4 n=1 Tax=Phragmites australis TaxID=29695 RepID=UPI002D77D002|nr:alpha-1,3-arabinosyltransferase XAT2-like isoform X4 [Phragmites australis]
MKAVERAKLVRSLRQESRRLRLLVLVIGFFLVTLTFVVASKPDALLFNLNGRLSVDQTPRSLLIRQRVDADDAASRRSADTLAAAAEDPKVVDDDDAGEEAKANANAKGTSVEEKRVLTSEPEQGRREEATASELLGGGGEEGRKGVEEGHQEHQHKVTLPTVSNYTIHDAEDSDNGKQEDEKTDTEIKLANDIDRSNGGDTSQQPALNNLVWGKLLCDFSNFRANVCEMRGNIRIHPNASSVMYMEPAGSKRDEQWKVKPYPRKGDELCLSHITELTVKSSKVAPECTKYHDVPAVVFALTGYTGNLFHDFTDVLVPLFTTASEFNGEVQFLITDMAIWWTRKYAVVFEKLTKYPLIDFNKDDQVHCFKHAIVGLHAYMEFTIDPLKAPHNYSMVDFNRFMRRAYSLPRDAVIALGEIPKTKPRLLIISRQRTRMFLNLNEIVAMAEEIGYEVVIEEANVNSNVAHFAKVVNSVNVMMGVHGAGLTNCVFLPHNAILIQIVPWGALDGICRVDFGNPAEQMGLRYRHYSIGVHESSLTEQYPLDHKIFKNPLLFHKNGFEFVRQTFMDKQNVRLDCNRFRPVLLEALDQLHQ